MDRVAATCATAGCVTRVEHAEKTTKFAVTPRIKAASDAQNRLLDQAVRSKFARLKNNGIRTADQRKSHSPEGAKNNTNWADGESDFWAKIEPGRRPPRRPGRGYLLCGD